MISSGSLESLVLSGVTTLGREVGRGSYGRVYAVRYCETTCAAKEIHHILLDQVGPAETRQVTESFIRECHQCSKLRHPNVVQFLGVFYPTTSEVATRIRLPAMVMEMMACSLTSLVGEHVNIPLHVKFEIVHDVSLGLCFLHSHNPPIVHRDLSSNNILLTTHLVAKISDLGLAKVIPANNVRSLTKLPGTQDFMPPEAFTRKPVYGVSLDVFSFAGIILHTFNQQWPDPLEQVQFDFETRKMVALSEVERRQLHLDNLTGGAKVLRPLVEKCLDIDPNLRPTVKVICEKIEASRKVYNKESQADIITLHRQNEWLRAELERKEAEIEGKEILLEEREAEINRLIISMQQLSIRSNAPVLSQITSRERSSKSKLKEGAVPLIPAVCSGRYQIKWTRLADLPARMYGAYAVADGTKIYVAGGDSPTEHANHEVYMYNFTVDSWEKLPLSGHYNGVLQIIGSRLVIIGGRNSATKERTNKLSTFDEASGKWISYYPDLPTARNMPGVTTHLELVIVAGGGVSYGNTKAVLDDIVVLNWIENSDWRELQIRLPKPMYDFSPIVYEDSLLIIGYTGNDMRRHSDMFSLPVVNITSVIDHLRDADASDWTKLASPVHLDTTTVQGLLSPVIVGGQNQNFTQSTSDLKLYESVSKSWWNIGMLPFPRLRTTAVAIGNSAFVVIGGCTASSSLSNVELAQAELTNKI